MWGMEGEWVVVQRWESGVRGEGAILDIPVSYVDI